MISWNQIVLMAKQALKNKGLNGIYQKRLQFEIEQIDIQGLNRYWIEAVNNRHKFTKNPNNLVLPWLLGLCAGDAKKDPIASRTDPVLTSAKYCDVMEVLNTYKSIPPEILEDNDRPDIDIDCLPDARDKIKEYANARYGARNVCSVGTMQSYLFKQAIIDVAKALTNVGPVSNYESESRYEDTFNAAVQVNKSLAMEATKELTAEVDQMQPGGFSSCKGKVIREGIEKECGARHNGTECPECGSKDTETITFGKMMYGTDDEGGFKSLDYASIRSYYNHSEFTKQVVDTAIGLIGRYKTFGKHAGALIIADRDLFGNIPMYVRKDDEGTSKDGKKTWVSLWSEGRNPQLSKFGYTKWDILGLLNLKYIYECCKLININHGVSFGPLLEGWDFIDPENDMAGKYWKDGKEYIVSLNDLTALKLADESRTDAIFQFDTELAKRTLANGVRNFNDLLIFNAMGHPGPMAFIPEYAKRRDGEVSWEAGENEKIKELLHDTFGIVVYQEQLASLLQNIAGFTSPEAQEARKAVAKKWTEKLKPVRQKWIDGATPILGVDSATAWWDDKLVPFGRYAFNRCLGKDTLVTDVATNVTKTIEQWFEQKDCELPLLLSDNGEDLIINQCEDIHYNGIQEVFLVEFDDNTTECLTLNHKLKCYDGQFHTIQEIFERGLEITSTQVAAATKTEK